MIKATFFTNVPPFFWFSAKCRGVAVVFCHQFQHQSIGPKTGDKNFSKDTPKNKLPHLENFHKFIITIVFLIYAQKTKKQPSKKLFPLLH